ncbi:putative fatty acid beta hydroxylase [uncultured Alphaproteobacteria bacterium]|uniref:Putative fatty acid beta hydroxylase n=1 Tax=uncultured Alphaproteobacteria bacterium TaxID=91750 RepID=A0A212JQW8_9PROT|nr:putative fatty acid beta hydroxylase [uncultured Alphaproteobacteria bacterium]
MDSAMTADTALPAAGFDATLGFVREGYAFISRHCERLGADAFRTRFLLRPVVCARGRAAAEMFYADDLAFTRRGAIPGSVRRLLQDDRSVQSLDAAAHRERKMLFAKILGGAAVEHAVLAFGAALRAAMLRWKGGEVVLHRAVREVLARVALDLSGIAADAPTLAARTRELGAMIDAAGSVGPANWRALWLRRRTEAWARGLVAAYRDGRLPETEGGALALIAGYRDGRGEPLPEAVAAVELLNVLRPTVAIGRYVVFAAHALVRRPDWREAFAGGGEDDLLPFVQEVRRFYPFFPAIAGRARQEFAWRGHRFRRGDLTILDLYGTNHHPELWPEPEAFRPERFRGWEGDAFALVAQGGGDAAVTHRCPGEDLTVALTVEAVRVLCRDARFSAPPQDLSVSLARVPALPESGMILRFA